MYRHKAVMLVAATRAAGKKGTTKKSAAKKPAAAKKSTAAKAAAAKKTQARKPATKGPAKGGDKGPAKQPEAKRTWVDETARSVYSQNGEDGMLEHVFATIGVEHKTFLEFGFDVPQCNSWRLLDAEGWRGTLIDRDPNVIRRWGTHTAARQHMRAAVHVFRSVLDAETINQVLCDHGRLEGEIDLLSIDVDGMDWWLWRALDCLSPRVVVIEYNPSLGPERSVVLPYDRGWVWGHDRYFGASLEALARLGRAKGYRLVGCPPQGVNAFFVRDDIEGIPEMAVADAFRAPGLDLAATWSQLEDKAWIEVGPDGEPIEEPVGE